MQLRRYRFRRGLARARRVIAVSERPGAICRIYGHPAQPIRRVYNAPDAGFYDLSGHSAEAHHDLERYQIQYPFLLYAWAISARHKEYAALGGSVRRVARELLDPSAISGDLRLVIIGNTISKYPSVRHAVIKSRIEHLGPLPGFRSFRHSARFYESAAAFVFLSRYEGIRLAAAGGHGCGTPVVASNVSSLPEVVGDAAVQVNPENVFDIARGVREAVLAGRRCAPS